MTWKFQCNLCEDVVKQAVHDVIRFGEIIHDILHPQNPAQSIYVVQLELISDPLDRLAKPIVSYIVYRQYGVV